MRETMMDENASRHYVKQIGYACANIIGVVPMTNTALIQDNKSNEHNQYLDSARRHTLSQTWPRKAERKTTQFCRKGEGKN
jgi:hypothetical protein